MVTMMTFIPSIPPGCTPGGYYPTPGLPWAAPLRQSLLDAVFPEISDTQNEGLACQVDRLVLGDGDNLNPLGRPPGAPGGRPDPGAPAPQVMRQGRPLLS